MYVTVPPAYNHSVVGGIGCAKACVCGWGVGGQCSVLLRRQATCMRSPTGLDFVCKQRNSALWRVERRKMHVAGSVQTRVLQAVPRRCFPPTAVLLLPPPPPPRALRRRAYPLTQSPGRPLFPPACGARYSWAAQAPPPPQPRSVLPSTTNHYTANSSSVLTHAFEPIHYIPCGTAVTFVQDTIKSTAPRSPPPQEKTKGVSHLTQFLQECFILLPMWSQVLLSEGQGLLSLAAAYQLNQTLLLQVEEQGVLLF